MMLARARASALTASVSRRVPLHVRPVKAGTWQVRPFEQPGSLRVLGTHPGPAAAVSTLEP